MQRWAKERMPMNAEAISKPDHEATAWPAIAADVMAQSLETVGGDGFAIQQGLWPGYVGPFVDQVVPLAPATRRGARGVHGDHPTGAPAGVLAPFFWPPAGWTSTLCPSRRC